jgi:hypothetical protein
MELYRKSGNIAEPAGAGCSVYRHKGLIRLVILRIYASQSQLLPIEVAALTCIFSIRQWSFRVASQFEHPKDRYSATIGIALKIYQKEFTFALEGGFKLSSYMGNRSTMSCSWWVTSAPFPFSSWRPPALGSGFQREGRRWSHVKNVKIRPVLMCN